MLVWPVSYNINDHSWLATASEVFSIIAIISLFRLFYFKFSRQKDSSSFRDYISYSFSFPSSSSFSRRQWALSLICLSSRSFLDFRSALCLRISSMLPLISFIRSSTNPTSFFSPSASSINFLRAPVFSLWLRCISSTMPIKTQLRWFTLLFSSSMRVLQKW